MIHHIFKSNRSSVKSQPKPRKQSLNAAQLQSQEGRGSGGGVMVYAYWYLFTAAVRFLLLRNLATIYEMAQADPKCC
jgi:hypothetical protein